MTEEEVQAKQAVREALSRGAKIRFAWDAGGDETPVWQEKTGFMLDDAPAGTIIDAIIRMLELPGAGEHYHKGGGELFFTPEGALAIRFTAEEYISYYEYDVPEIAYHLVRMEDRGNLHAYLGRGRIFVQAKYTPAGGWRLSVNANMREGDAPELTTEDEAYYINLLSPLAQAHCAVFGPRDGGWQLGGSVDVYFEVKAAEEMDVEVEGQYRLTENYVNKEVILIP